MAPIIQIDRVCKRFGRKTVLKDVSLEVPEGVVFALLGENGAGKSTLIRGLLGYHKFEKGTVRVVDLDPRRKPLDVRRQVGYVSDAPALYEWMSVADIGWFASGFYADGFLDRYRALAQEFQLPLTTKIKNLSKGMRAKVALALAMSFDPKLLILDEPTSGLDPVVRRQFLESMVDRAAAGQTVFLSSHQIHEVERVADWVAILHQGVLQVVAPLEELKSSTALVHFSLRDPLLPLPIEFESSDILHRIQNGRSWRLTMKRWDSSLEEKLRSNTNIFDLHVIRPNLEELYIAFTQSDLDRTSLKSKTQSGIPEVA